MNLLPRRLLWLTALWLVAASAVACKVPVFRYALERWSVDRYSMVAIVEDRQDKVVNETINELLELAESNVNVDVEVIDLSTLSDDDFWQIEGIEGDIETPLLQVFFPPRNGQRRKCWEGSLSSDVIGSWGDSPLRQQIRAQIASGVSAVWLLVEGLDEDENQRVTEIVNTALATASAEITIPQGVIRREDASEYLQEHAEASMEDVLRSDIPLKVDFQLLRLSRDNSDEPAMRAMIAGFAGDSEQAVLVPIFGRGRMFDAIAVDKADEQTILNACRYLVGECSCTVKALNPGVDLVLKADWQGHLGQPDVLITEIKEPTLVPVPVGNAASQVMVNQVPTGQLPVRSLDRWTVILLLLGGGIVLVLLWVVGRPHVWFGNHSD